MAETNIHCPSCNADDISKFGFSSMKKIRLIALALGVMIINTGFACLPPAYLSVSHWRSCVNTERVNTWWQWCLPRKAPSDCPLASWETLNRQKEFLPCPSKISREDSMILKIPPSMRLLIELFFE